jgi:prepilin-type processing-associated H-X9-DG protein
MITSCPNCGGPFQAAHEQVGSQVLCPHCQQVVTVPPEGAVYAAGPRVSTGQGSGDGLAAAALILGICAILPGLGFLTALVGVILGIIALTLSTRRKTMAWAGIVLSVLLSVGWLVAGGLGIRYAFRHAQNEACMSSLREISNGIAAYQADHGVMPPDLDNAIASGHLYPYALDCPFGPVEPWHYATHATPATTQGATAPVVHYDSDYFYHPAAAGAPPGTIIACDFRSNHPDGARNVLFADGHVEQMDEPTFQQAMNEAHNAAFAAALLAEDH